MNDRAPYNPIRSNLVLEDPTFLPLVAEFVAGLRHRIQEMQESFSSADLVRLRELAHRLKGAGGGYGFPTLTEQAAELEQAAMSCDTEACRKHLATLESTVERIDVRPTT